MDKIVDGIVFRGKYLPDVWEVRTFEKNGVMERSVRQVMEWEEVGNLADFAGPDALAKWALEPTEEQLAKWAEEDAERKVEKRKDNALRAKTACRRIIISEGFNELLTLTYRENQEDRDLCKKHFKEFVRRMKRELGGVFRYCASFEKQERGAMHVHMAVHKLPKHAEFEGVKINGWELGTRVWRKIVGKDNGLCFVGGKNKFGGRAKYTSLAKMAGYVSKYIMKEHEEVPEGSNRYSHSEGQAAPKPETIRLVGCDLITMIATCFECADGDVLHSWSINPINGTMWLVKERPSREYSH